MPTCWRATACAAVVVLAGCGSTPDVRHLATGRPDVQAHELTGSDLTELRRMAQRLCPMGGEILRQSGQTQIQRRVAAGSWWRDIGNRMANWTDPDTVTAQMVVLCREPAERGRLQAAAVAVFEPAVAASDPAAVPVTSPPIGPITVEW